MMKTNEELPEIEQLGQHEFNLDTEEQQRLQEDGDGEVQKVINQTIIKLRQTYRLTCLFV